MEKKQHFLLIFSITLKSETLDLWKVNTECNSILLCLFPQPSGEINTTEWHKIRYLLLWFHHFCNKPASKACLYISCRWINHDQSHEFWCVYPGKANRRHARIELPFIIHRFRLCIFTKLYPIFQWCQNCHNVWGTGILEFFNS